MKFIIPPKIRLSQRVVYEIVWSDEICGDEDTLGECRYDVRQIAISTKQSETDKMKTFIHETLHAISHEFKIPLTHKVIYALEHIIYRIMALNGWL